MDLVSSCKTEEVLVILKQNREKHEIAFKEAQEGYLVKAKDVLNKKLKAIKSGKIEDVNVHLTIPTNHLSEYDTVIKMLEMHSKDTVELNVNEVRQFIEDKWSWSSSFAMTNSVYMGLKKG